MLEYTLAGVEKATPKTRRERTMTEYNDKLMDSIAGKTQTVTYEMAIEYCASYYYTSAMNTRKRIDARYREGKGETGLTRSMERGQFNQQAKAEAQMELIAMMYARSFAEVQRDVAEMYESEEW